MAAEPAVRAAQPPALKVIVTLDGEDHELPITPAVHGTRIDTVALWAGKIHDVLGASIDPRSVGLEPEPPELPPGFQPLANVFMPYMISVIHPSAITNA